MLSPWISRWWDIANERRQNLIIQKHQGKGLSKDQEQELEMLQKVAEALMEFGSPPEVCEHQWIDARNALVENGELCLKCFSIRAGNVTTDKRIHVAFCSTCDSEGDLHRPECPQKRKEECRGREGAEGSRDRRKSGS
jgi:hypothetical protein